jgi:pimeloyl-ACP methyl ester carboxylesterase
VRFLARLGVIPDSRLEAARQRYGSADYRAASGVVRDVLVATVAEDYRAEISRVRAPVTLVWGTADPEAPIAAARAATELFGGPSELVALDAVGHFVPSEAPGALAAAVKGSL